LAVAKQTPKRLMCKRDMPHENTNKKFNEQLNFDFLFQLQNLKMKNKILIKAIQIALSD
jgi:hypothetical protein